MRMSRTEYERVKARIHAKGYSKEQSRPDVSSPHESQLFFLELAADEDAKQWAKEYHDEEAMKQIYARGREQALNDLHTYKCVLWRRCPSLGNRPHHRYSILISNPDKDYAISFTCVSVSSKTYKNQPDRQKLKLYDWKEYGAQKPICVLLHKPHEVLREHILQRDVVGPLSAGDFRGSANSIGVKYKLAALCGVTIEFEGSVFKAEEELVDAVYKYCGELFEV